MAVAMARTAGSWRGVSSAMAASSVRCAVEVTRTVQRVLVARKGTAAAQVWMSSCGDGAQLRCQEAYEPSRMYYGRRGGGDARSGMASTKVAGMEEEEGVQAQMGRSRAEALCAMATRAWRRLGDAERAEQLFLAALQLAPGDCAVQACYAQFLWQCDASCPASGTIPGAHNQHSQIPATMV